MAQYSDLAEETERVLIEIDIQHANEVFNQYRERKGINKTVELNAEQKADAFIESLMLKTLQTAEDHGFTKLPKTNLGDVPEWLLTDLEKVSKLAHITIREALFIWGKRSAVPGRLLSIKTIMQHWLERFEENENKSK